jgi:hypothetical protein
VIELLCRVSNMFLMLGSIGTRSRSAKAGGGLSVKQLLKACQATAEVVSTTRCRMSTDTWCAGLDLNPEPAD